MCLSHSHGGTAVFQNASTRLAALAALALCAGACGDNSSGPSADRGTITDFVASVSIDSTQGAVEATAVPRPMNGGPAIAVAGHLTIVNGGTATLTVTSPTPFDKVFVAGAAPISRLFTPVTGFFQVPLPAATTAANLLIVFPQTLPANTFNLYFAASDPAGKVGALQERSVRALVVGTGDIQVTAAWDTESDVDLHVVDPGANEIYWADRQSPTGGQLDLDSNAACAIDSVSNENITWPVGAAPQGTYTVRLDYWSNCSAAQTNYTVLVNNGGDIHIYNGSFTGSGDAGGYGAGILITQFTRTTGPLPAPAAVRSAALPVGPTTKTPRRAP